LFPYAISVRFDGHNQEKHIFSISYNTIQVSGDLYKHMWSLSLITFAQTQGLRLAYVEKAKKTLRKAKLFIREVSEAGPEEIEAKRQEVRISDIKIRGETGPEEILIEAKRQEVRISDIQY
jgi:hypothetical protein